MASDGDRWMEFRGVNLPPLYHEDDQVYDARPSWWQGAGSGRRISMYPPPGVPDVDARDREMMFAMYESAGIPRADVVAWYEDDRSNRNP